MTMNALALPASPTTQLRVVRGTTPARPTPWYERRSFMRGIVGGCPDHWWNPTARTTAACTCDRF